MLHCFQYLEHVKVQLSYCVLVTIDVCMLYFTLFYIKNLNKLLCVSFVHVRWGPCPHSMARPRVADGGTASSFGG
jgi:hypothetical protein